MRCLNCFKEHDEQMDMCPYCGYIIREYRPEAYHLMPGSVLDGRYMLGIVTGVGGFGIVYKAWDMKLERVVAIKEFYPSGMVNRVPGSPDVLMVSGKNKKMYELNKARFLCEARNTVKFAAHKNIINVYEYFEENNTAYMVMDLLQGIPLNKFMKKYNKVNVENTVYVIGSVCEALKYLHHEKVIHRDISPDNIYICEDNSIILFDFGTAEFSDDNVKVMDVVIKAGYSPIEQYNNINEQGPWTDIYALGATMYVMLTGLRPPEASNRRINDELQPPHIIDPSIPENLSNAVMKAMAVDKHMRFTSVDEFQKAIQGEKKVLTLETERKKRKRGRLLAIGAALIAVAAGVGVFLMSLAAQRDSVVLPPADLTIWVSGDETSGEYQAMSQIVEEFCEAYPDVDIDIVAVSEEEYSEKVLDASRKGNLPHIFDSSGIEESKLDGVVDVKDIIKSDNAKDCYFLSDYTSVYDSYYKVPMGVNIPTAYFITSGNGSIECDLDVIKRIGELGDEYAVNELYRNILESSFNDELEPTGDYKDFFRCQEPVLVSSSKDYFTVRRELANRKVKVIAIGTGSIACQYDNEWSIGEGSKAEVKAAKRFLEYMLTSTAQDIWYLGVEDKSGIMPVNKDIFKTYTTDTYKAHMREFFDLLEEYHVEEACKNE